MGIIPGHNKFVQQALKYGFSLFGLPKTGQTTKRRTGDDGDYQKGYPKTPPHFTDNGDGTITDNATGLMWAKDGNGAGCNDGNTIAWVAAIDFANGLSFAGYSDWRLPNAKELISIVDYSEFGPCVDSIFINTKNARYWSSTIYAAASGIMWVGQFYAGALEIKGMTDSYYVRLVRGGQ